MIPVIGLLIGVIVGIVLDPTVPLWMQPYLPIAVIVNPVKSYPNAVVFTVNTGSVEPTNDVIAPGGIGIEPA